MSAPIDLRKIYNDQVRIKPRKFRIDAEPSFAPSSLGGTCLRKIYYKYNKSPEEKGFPIKSARVLALGTVIGDHLSRIYRKAGVLVDYHNPDGSIPISFGKKNPEFPVSAPELGVKRGFIDAVLLKGGVLNLGEFKSINDRGYGYLNGDPKMEHLAQGVIYFHLFNKMLKEGAYSHIKALEGFERAEGITFLYLNKNTSYLQPFHVSETSEIFKKIVTRLLYIMSLGENSSLPPRTEDFCRSCDYELRCVANQHSPCHGGLIDL